MNTSNCFLLIVLALISLLSSCQGFGNILFNPRCPMYVPGSDFARACHCKSQLDGRGSTINCDLREGVDFYKLMEQIEEGSILIDSIEISCSEAFGGLGAIVRKLPKLRVYHLRLSHCGISSMDMALLEETAFWLENLELPYNNLSETNNLHLLYHLKTLDLKGNKFTDIPPDNTFAYNPDLETVDLTSNYELSGSSTPFCKVGRQIQKTYPGRPDVTVFI